MNTLQEQIKVNNAGIVLLNNYIPMLFERLGLTQNHVFNSAEHQMRAVEYLQYVVTGLNRTEDIDLALNKVMCGISKEQPVSSELEVSGREHELIDSLLRAAIDNWKDIGSHSSTTFRGNWLLRNGLLIEQKESWELYVKKRAYDILLNNFGYSFSIIKYPWMRKTLHVIWPTK